MEKGELLQNKFGLESQPKLLDSALLKASIARARRESPSTAGMLETNVTGTVKLSNWGNVQVTNGLRQQSLRVCDPRDFA
jgi:hypothetical protein